jgi:hypothetical protein
VIDSRDPTGQSGDPAPDADAAERPYPVPYVQADGAYEGGQTSPPRPGGWNYWDIFFFALFAIPAYLLAFTVCLGGFRLLGLLGESEAGLETLITQTPLIVAVQFVWWGLLLGYIYGVVSIKYRLPFGPAIGWRGVDRPPTVYLLWGVLLAVSVALLAHLMPTATERMPIEDLLRDRTSLIVLALFGILIAPAIEELVFRGFLYAAVERSHGTLLAVLVTSTVFSLPHASQYGWRWQNLLLLTYVGVIFGVVRARTQSVVPSTLLHTGYNATLFAGLFAAGDQILKS